jgi:hypothetical protein
MNLEVYFNIVVTAASSPLAQTIGLSSWLRGQTQTKRSTCFQDLFRFLLNLSSNAENISAQTARAISG